MVTNTVPAPKPRNVQRLSWEFEYDPYYEGWVAERMRHTWPAGIMDWLIENVAAENWTISGDIIWLKREQDVAWFKLRWS